MFLNIFKKKIEDMTFSEILNKKKKFYKKGGYEEGVDFAKYIEKTCGESTLLTLEDSVFSIRNDIELTVDFEKGMLDYCKQQRGGNPLFEKGL
jgi:hypothetical protein